MLQYPPPGRSAIAAQSPVIAEDYIARGGGRGEDRSDGGIGSVRSFREWPPALGWQGGGSSKNMHRDPAPTSRCGTATRAAGNNEG
jgi:hypothetical protein